MQISIFPKAKPHPVSTEEKIENIKYYCKSPIIVEVEDEENLFDLVTTYVWSPFIFSKFRKEEDFLHCDLLVLDIDSGMTIPEAESVCVKNSLMALIAPSPSHKPEHHKFRMVFPLVGRISDKTTFLATWEHLAKKFTTDKICKDVTRSFFACLPDPDYSIFVEGEMLKPATPRKMFTKDDLIHRQEFVTTDNIEDKSILELLYDEIPDKINKTVAYFFENAHTGMDGEWTCSLNNAVFTLTLRGTPEENILLAVQKVSPQPLDNRDMDTIERAVKDGLGSKSELQNEEKDNEYREKIKNRKKEHLI